MANSSRRINMKNGLLTLFTAYGLGCFSTGYYLVCLQRGIDIRQTGSGSTGASNVGRVLGSAGFAMTFVGDFLKGVLAIVVANFTMGSLFGAGLAMVAVVTGHLFPLQLGGRGGKGIATAVGAIAACDFRLTLGLLSVFALLYLLTRQWLFCGMIVIVVAPCAASLMKLPGLFVLALAAVATLLVFAHRDNIRQRSSNPVAPSSGE
jgi:acyl phosphate:glycerol-3-phosphate acyltransferase